MGLGHQQENAKTGCSGSTELPWLCCGVGSPLHSLLPSLRRIQGRRKGGMAESSQQRLRKGKRGQAVPAPRSFSQAQAWHAQWSRAPDSATALSANNPANTPLPPPSTRAQECIHLQGHWGSMTG